MSVKKLSEHDAYKNGTCVRVRGGNVMISWKEARARRLAEMSPEQRREYEAQTPRSRAALLAAEIAYEARMSAGLTQAELGERLGRKQTYISALESGRANPTIATLEELVDATGKRLELNIV